MKRKQIWKPVKNRDKASARPKKIDDRRKREREEILVGLVLCLTDLIRQREGIKVLPKSIGK